MSEARSKSRSPAPSPQHGPAPAALSQATLLPQLDSEGICSSAGGQDEETLAQTIARQLSQLKYECANCLEVIKHTVATWGCRNCYRVFHLYCIKKWALQEESGAGKTFRCPHCQAPQIGVNRYYCFCGKVVDPSYDPSITPHSCGDTCGRARGHGCPHTCPNICHPGPCADCTAIVPEIACPCGKTTYSYRCGKPDPKTTCSNTCDKLLSCGQHTCTMPCHHGPCGSCTAVEKVACNCGKDYNDLPCGSPPFICGKPCGRTQRCGKHQCDTICHGGACPPCDTDPKLVVTCPCGKMPVDPSTRKTCEDPVPLCGNVCGRVLSCGNHYCDQKCHLGRCGSCTSKIQAHCGCGSTVAKLTCKDALSFTCSKRCKAKMTCGKHECEVICCRDRTAASSPAHACQRPCQKKLPCGHTCTERCHRGSCPPCVNIITQAMHCRCGFELLMPPQPCSTPPPACTRPCTLPSTCGHDLPAHKCHYGECPPCAAPVQRRCAGDHTIMSNILCCAPPVSCGQQCGRPLECGHLCHRKCHAGPCIVDPKARCGQHCGKIISACDHPCQAKCHPGTECPKCTFQAELTCPCGHLRQKLPCSQYLNRLAKHCKDGGDARFLLECTSDCIFEQRLNALKSINSGSASSSHAQSGGGGMNSKRVLYSIRLWNIALKNIDAVKNIEGSFADFIKSRENTQMLPPMLREKRAIVHELALFYHLHCEAVDEEPNRTCFISKTMYSAVPPVLLSAAVYRDDNDPSAFVERALASMDEMSRRVIQFEGDKLNEITVHHALKTVMGTFVVVPAQGAFLGSGQSSTVNKFFAVFPSQVERQHGYAVLRKHGCPVLYHMFGEAPPPKRFIWEPDRVGPTDAFIPGSVQRDYHADPMGAPAAAASSAPRAATAAGSSWSALLAPKKESAKERKINEKQHVETSNMFSVLKK